ncbi:COL10A [Mytilus coruscus]|uniref:COL10A n=1 Tax=Mytilus coruscus TaxID=42192 RepID=A0A6J8BUH4_MYTCO|nr:COL10A [Mytilus coruscus]
MKCNFNFAIYALLCSCFLDVNAELSKADGGVSQLWKELNELKAVLTETRLDLFHTRRELKGTKDVLAETRVRLEIMEKKQEKTRETLMETSRDLVETQTDLKETKKLIDQNEGNINVIHKTNNLKRLIDSTDVLHQVQVDIQNLKANMATVQSQVKNSQTPIIGFTSTISKDVVNLGDNQVIRFDTVYTNEGGDYNNLTGIFTCEIPGLYAFYVHTLAEPGKHLETEITKNLKPMVYTYAYDKEAFSSGSNMAVMILQKGDAVLVRSHGSEHSHNGSVIDFWYTSFSGFLIAP